MKHKETPEELQVRLAALFEQAPDGIFISDLEEHYTDVNSAGCRMLGYSREELLGMTIRDLIPSEDIQRHLSEKQELLKGATRVVGGALRRRDGTFLPVEISMKILPDGRWQAIVRDITGRKEMERALREREDELNRAQAVAKTGSWRLDVRRNELSWTVESYRIFGVALGTPMSYEGFLECVHPDDREYVDRKWKAALQGEPYDIIHRVIAGDDVKWVRERAELAFTDVGELIGGIGTTQDITDLKLAELALAQAHETERRLRTELEQVTCASNAVSEAIAELQTSDVSAVLQVLAREAQALTEAEYVAIGVGTDPGRPFSPWISVGMTEEIAALIGKAPRPVGVLGSVAREGRVVRMSDLRREATRPGLPRHHPEMSSFLGAPILRRGQPVGNIYLANKRGGGEFTEQDERLVQMLAARASVAIEIATLYAGEATQRAWLQTVIDQTPEGIILLDRTGHVTAMNRAILALAYGETGTVDVYGNPSIFDIRHVDGSPVPFEELPVVRALQSGEVTVGKELLLRQRDGRLVPILANAAPVLDERGQITGAIVVIQDVSIQKELERLREEWTSIVAHDLRQPVTGIVLSAEMLLKPRTEPLPEPARKAAEIILSAAQRIDRMIHDLLDASRIESRRLSLEKKRVNLPELVSEVLQEASGATGGYTVRYVGPEVLAAWADPQRLHQVLANLVSNATKYGTPGTELRIDLIQRENAVETVVSNQGAGIPPDEVPLLFSRFSRTREAREGGVSGLGLGLYICKGIVESHGGRIWVESMPGDTTSFHFTLPVGVAAAGDEI